MLRLNYWSWNVGLFTSMTADRQGLATLMDRRTADIREFLNSIKARPIVGSRPLSLEDQATNERARQKAEARKAARVIKGHCN